MKSKNCGPIITSCTSSHGITTLPLLLLFLLCFSPYFLNLVAAQKPSDASSSYNDMPNPSNVSPSLAVIVIALVLAFFITGAVSIYIQQCANSSLSSNPPVVISGDARLRGNARGLDPSIIETFPTFNYSAVKELKIGKGSLECAVCLNEFEEDDTLRLLPKCDHVFHSECIDAWLVGHATCPVCRANLVPDLSESTHEVDSDSEPVIPRGDVQITVAGINNGGETTARVEIPKRKFLRSHSTGHSLVIQLVEDSERFTLRLPAEVRKQLFDRAKLKRATSLVALPRAPSSRRGYRSGEEGSGSSRYGRIFGRSAERWGFTPFGFRLGSFRSTAKAGANGDMTAVNTGSKRNSGTSVRPMGSLPPLPV